ncbi:MAG: CRTAC1 family protein [Polyangiaceae bacterium]
MPLRRTRSFASPPALLALLSSLAILSLSACDGDGDGTGGSGGTGTGSVTTTTQCLPGSKWAPGAQAFQDSTAKWGLEALAVQGVRLNAVDFDRDGWTDLLVRRGGNSGDDFADGGVRQTWLLRNTHNGTFEDVTQKSGIRQLRVAPDPDKGRPGEVIAFGDVDNDGDLDVFTGFTNNLDPASAETTELLLSNGDGTFTLGPETNPFRVAAPKLDSVAGVTFVDFDRDGNLDIWVVQNTNAGAPVQDRLYKGDGTGNFTDVTLSIGLKTKAWSVVSDLNKALGHSIGWSSNACDLNNDGNPELLAGSYGRAPNHLWQSGGPANGFFFTNRSIDSGYAFDDRVDWTDNESARCWCKLHPDATDCDGVPPPMYIACNTDDDAFRWDHTFDRNPFRLGGNSGATECIDIDNDGDIDLLTGEIVHWDVGSSSDPAELLLNTGEPDARFERPGNDLTGLAREHSIPDWNDGIMTGSVFDFDNDGWPDVYLGASDYPGNHGLLFHQTTPATFEPVPIDLGIDHHRSHGSVVADFDNDGDLDIIVGHSRARCDPKGPDDCYPTAQVRFFENVLGQNGHFLRLTLTGAAGTNRSAIGARVTVKSGDITQTRDVDGGHGHYGAQDDLTVHFGLGDACEAEVTVRWPDAALTTSTFTLQADQRYTLVQGEEPQVFTPTP